MRFPSSVKRDPGIDVWMHKHSGQLGAIAQRWFEVMRACGDDVRELLHDGHPTACAGDAAFGYVNAFKDHVNVGFFRGANIADPHGILEGNGKFMRHVKLRPEQDVDAAALTELIETAYTDMKRRLKAESLLTNPLASLGQPWLNCFPLDPVVLPNLDYPRLKRSFEYFVEHYPLAELVTPDHDALVLAISDFVESTQDFCRERVGEIDRDLLKRDAYTLSFLREHFTRD